jgi:hypothetical protein
MSQDARLQDCPLCIDPSPAWLIQPHGDRYHGNCPRCGLLGPGSLNEEYAIKDWNSIPRRPGPQTQAVLDELVHILTRESVIADDLAHVVLNPTDREAFLKEQGVS